MKRKMVIFLLLLYLSCPTDEVFAEDPVIVDDPDSVTAVDGTTVQFSCVVEFSGMGTIELEFFVNNTDTNAETIIQAGFKEGTVENLNPTTRRLNLTAIALSQYDNTKVYCRALYTDADGNLFAPVYSEHAVLIVKDAVKLSSTISSQEISHLVTSPTMGDDSIHFSPVVPSTSGLLSVSRIISTAELSSTLGISSVGLLESSSVDPKSNKDAVGLSSTISSDLVLSSTTCMSDSSMCFSPVVELSTSVLSSVSIIISTTAPSSTLGTSSVGLPKSSSTDPTFREDSNNTAFIVGSVLVLLVVLLLLAIGIRCLKCYCKIKEPHNNILPVMFTKPVPVTVHCLEGDLCLRSDSKPIEVQTELRDIADDKLVNNISYQETAMSSDNDTNIGAVPTAVENKSEGILVEVHVHVPHEIITEKTTCENSLKVKSEGVEDSYIHQDVRKTIDNDADSSLVTTDYKTTVEINEPIGFVNGNGVISRNCTGSSSTYVSHFVEPPGEISKEFDSSHKETGKLKSDIDMDFLDSVDKQCTKETTTDIAHGPQSKIIKSSSCPSVIYFNPVPPISSEPPPQIPHLVPQIQTPSIKTPSFFYIGNDKAMDDDTPYVHNSQATPRSMSVLQMEDDNYPWKHCDTLLSQMMNSLSLMRTDTDTSVDCIKEDKRQKPFHSLQNGTNYDDVG